MKIIVPDKVDPLIKDVLGDLGHEVNYCPGTDIDELNNIAKDYDAIIVRSYKLHDLELKGNIKAIGRAGAGVNNIPISKCSEKGIAVFNAPGANANAVKELVICTMILAARGIHHGIEWVKTLNEEVPKTVEKNKSKFKGKEIMGKSVGVIGLGAIGIKVANAACALGMDVYGYDPFITVENAWQLSCDVTKMEDLKSMLNKVDFITIHVPFIEETKGLINKDMFASMKEGTKLLNFSRAEIVEHKALIEAIEKGTIERYVTDFPTEDLMDNDNVIMVPHLGASTFEAEQNCAKMIGKQIDDFLKNGNVCNSVNFPKAVLKRNGKDRICICADNVPSIISKFTEILGKNKINIAEMINQSRDKISYSIIDIDSKVNENIIKEIEQLDDVVWAR